MKKIAVVTATRAEYGLLSPVIRELRKRESNELKVSLIATGTHLSSEYGMTIDEIGERIDHRIPIPVKSDTALDISANQAEVLVRFTRLFMEEAFDAVLLLGDRYESLAIAVAAGNTLTPVFHLCGGDTTEGAIDEWIRHAISKISYLHFTTNEESRRRVIQLGEDPARVFNFGSTSIDNIFALSADSKEKALESIGLDACRYALCTYHPATMEGGQVDGQIAQLLEAVRAFPDISFIVTKSNADQGGARINELLDEAARNTANLHVYASLGTKRYLSLLRYSEFVLGNSSSGIIEAPSFSVPTVNIGDRQKGRLQCESVINCEPDRDSIIRAIRLALSDAFREKCRDVVNPYGDGHAAERIARQSVETVMNGRIDLKKKFYDL